MLSQTMVNPCEVNSMQHDLIKFMCDVLRCYYEFICCKMYINITVLTLVDSHSHLHNLIDS